MRHIFNTKDFQLKNAAVCLGKFDGIHKGHRFLISKIQDFQSQGYQSVVFTFALHPSSLFSDQESFLIDSVEEKAEKLRQLGVDTLISYPFTKETAAMEPEQFIAEVLVKKIDAKVIIVGNDFHFGRERKGTVDTLKAYAKEYGYQVIAMDKIADKQEVVSSTRIRNAIRNGNMEEAKQLLTVPFAITGEVLHGKKLGRTIGMPTINQAVENNKILPPKGVYVSLVHLEDGVHGGITNVGTKPTVSGEEKIGIETNIFDYAGDLYGKCLRVELLYYVRGEIKFQNVEALMEQMHKDKKFGQQYLQVQEDMI